MLACSLKYAQASSVSATGGRFSFSLDIFEEDSSREGMTVSPMAMRVIHCDGVSTSPSGGGGNGDARGAIRLICWLVMAADTGCELGFSIRSTKNIRR